MLWGSSLKTIKKIASSIVLGSGIFVLVCATLKSVFVLVVRLKCGIFLSGLYLTCILRILSMVLSWLASGVRVKPSWLYWQLIYRFCSRSSESGSRQSSEVYSAHRTSHRISIPPASRLSGVGVEVARAAAPVVGPRLETLYRETCRLITVRSASSR